MGTADGIELEGVIGEGAFGTVFRASRTRRGRRSTVAVKVLTAAKNDGSLEARFRDEARFASFIDDPAVIRIEPPIQLGGDLALVMEFVDGAPVSEVLATRGAFPDGVAAELVAEVARALAVVHSARDHRGRSLMLLHRDLKPANLQLTTSGQVKILDFGVAHIREGLREADTCTGLTAGTPAYLAPERFDAVDLPAGDVYSLGVVLTELLTGRRPRQYEDPPRSTDSVRGPLLALAARMREPNHLRRPDLGEVESICREAAERSSDPPLALWSREIVPVTPRAVMGTTRFPVTSDSLGPRTLVLTAALAFLFAAVMASALAGGAAGVVASLL